MEAYYKKLDTTVEGVMAQEVNPFLMQGNHRTGIALREKVESFTLEDVKAWLAPFLLHSYAEIAIVGDFSEDQIISQIEQTLGALPDRALAPKVYLQERVAQFPREVDEKEFPFATELPRAYAGVYWETTDSENVFLSRRLNMLARVMDEVLRLEIREKYGDAYSPYAYSNSSQVYENYGYFAGVSQVTPGTSERVSQEILKLGALLFENGITEDQFQRAKKPLLNALTDYRRRNSYWLERVVIDSQSDKMKLFWADNMIDDYESMTAAEVDALAKAYLNPARAVRVEIFPEGTVDE